MYKNLRDYIDLLESKGELVRIKEFVDPVYEIAEFTNRVSKLKDGGKALLFENTGTQFPVLTNMMGSEKRILYTLGADSFSDITKRIDSLIGEAMADREGLFNKLKIIPTLAGAAKWLPKKIKGIPPCQEVVMYKPDLAKLPVLKCWPQDGGRFITLPLVHTNDPLTKKRNVGMYRMQLFSNNSTGMHWHKHKTGARHFDEFKGDKMGVAVAIGGDPIYSYAATAPLPDGIDEYLFAGFLRDKGVELVQCLTQDILVPADCDFIIEGYIDKSEPLVMEGPFGDHTGFYSLPDLYPTLHITAITHRKDAIYPATVVGVPPQEDKYIALATERLFLSPIKFAIAPEVEDLYLPEEGVGHNFAIIKIKKRYAGQAVKIAHAMWGAGQMMFNKAIVVVDGDINIRDHKALAKHISNHYNPKRDTYFSRGPLDVLDHTSPICGFGGKICIDATVKFKEEGQDIANNTPLIEYTHNRENLNNINSKIIVILDKEHNLDNRYINLWLLGSNADPIRDCHFIKNNITNEDSLVIDARKKVKGVNGFNRDWPDIAESNSATQERVDILFKQLYKE